MDSYLEEIIQTAEAGGVVPPVQLITCSGDWITGSPCSSARFREVSFQHFLHDTTDQVRVRTKRHAPGGDMGQDSAHELASAAFAQFGALDDESHMLNLEEAFLAFGGRGDGLRLPVVRVNAAAVASWWITGQTHVESKSAGSGWVGGGVSFPLDDLT